MPESGLFITLFDKDTLGLYLDRGIYSFHMPPEEGDISPYSRHYAALGDYACCRGGDHVFFFLKREIVYGGQLLGPAEHGAFYLNGPYSPMGRRAEAPVVWDESDRGAVYKPTDRPGIFKRERDDEIRCQPYLIRFEDRLGLAGTAITSDDLYFRLGEYPFPLPSNSISGMSFCTLTPGETRIALELCREAGEAKYGGGTQEPTELTDDPVPFQPEYTIQDLSGLDTESHLEATVLANPGLLPPSLRPREAALCRQVPISPFKPYQMDRADICYYQDAAFRDGTLPNHVIELKYKRAGSPELRQVVRYLKWLYKLLGDDAAQIRVDVFAPSFARTFKVPAEYKDQVEMHAFADDA